MNGKWRVIVLIIATLFMVGVFSAYIKPAQPTNSNLVPKILTPLSEEVVAGRVLFMAVEDSGNESLVTQVKLEFSKDGSNFTLIDEQPGIELATNPQGIGSLGSWNAFWNTTDLVPGSYFLRVTMTNNQSGDNASQTIPVTVDKIPIPKMNITFENVTGKATFNGNASIDNGSIVQYEWDFGDNQFATGSNVSHTYANITQLYFPMLTVVDNQGFRDTEYFAIPAVENPELWQNQTATPVNDCVPVSIALLKSETADTKSIDFGQFAMPGDATKKKLGGFNNIDISNPEPYDIRFWFEIKATLKEGSNPKLCSEKQEVKGIAHYGSITTPKPYPNGFNSATYDLDDYTAPSKFKEHDGLIIRWLDAPGFYLGENDVTTSGADGVSFYAHFKATVTSKDGQTSVMCTWDVRMKVNNTGGVVEAPNISNATC